MDIDHNKPRGESPFENKLPKREPQRHLSFGSKTEYACGVLLEKYVPGFELEMGKTMQVHIGYNKRCDFVVDNVFFEWHPINLQTDFMNHAAYKQITGALRFCKPHIASEIVEGLKHELAGRYIKYREFIIHQTFGKDAELIVAGDFDSFYKRVLRRFGENVPSMNDTEIAFRKLSR
jgi:hypothetical protein